MLELFNVLVITMQYLWLCYLFVGDSLMFILRYVCVLIFLLILDLEFVTKSKYIFESYKIKIIFRDLQG